MRTGRPEKTVATGGICPRSPHLLFSRYAVRTQSSACRPGAPRVQSAKRCRVKIELIGEQALDFGSGQDGDGPAPRRRRPASAGEGRYQEERPGNSDLVEFTEKGVIGNDVVHRYLPKDTGAWLIGRTGSGNLNGWNEELSSGALVKG